ncbi:ABC transporter permease [Catenulispora subtropica]|uniref:ABC-2 family transporter protein n=1 Tax=Catenulispora subtropica TaxID=450798 RepID=A0ABP5C3Z9_9ACTN
MKNTTVPVYTLVARQSFRRYVTYRGAMLGGVVTNTAFGAVKALIVTAVWRQRTAIGGYDLADVLTYTFIAQALIGPMSLLTNNLDIPARVRSGDIGTDLFRPVDFQAYWLAQDIGRAAFTVVGRALPPFVVGALLFRLRVPADPRVWAAFLVAVVLGVFVSFALRYLAAMSAFWLLDEKGITGFMNMLTMFFGGLTVPVVLFPGWLGSLARMLPWASVILVPVNTLLGKLSGASLLGAYLFEASWAVALLALGRLVTKRARHRLVVQGG